MTEPRIGDHWKHKPTKVIVEITSFGKIALPSLRMMDESINYRIISPPPTERLVYSTSKKEFLDEFSPDPDWFLRERLIRYVKDNGRYDNDKEIPALVDCLLESGLIVQSQRALQDEELETAAAKCRAAYDDSMDEEEWPSVTGVYRDSWLASAKAVIDYIRSLK